MLEIETATVGKVVEALSNLDQDAPLVCHYRGTGVRIDMIDDTVMLFGYDPRMILNWYGYRKHGSQQRHS